MNTVVRLLGITSIALCAATSLAGGLYKWVDADGKIHYSDAPHNADAQSGSSETLKQTASGAPLEAYRAFRNAILAGDKDAVLASLSPTNRNLKTISQLTPEHLKLMIGNYPETLNMKLVRADEQASTAAYAFKKPQENDPERKLLGQPALYMDYFFVAASKSPDGKWKVERTSMQTQPINITQADETKLVAAMLGR